MSDRCTSREAADSACRRQIRGEMQQHRGEGYIQRPWQTKNSEAGALVSSRHRDGTGRCRVIPDAARKNRFWRPSRETWGQGWTCKKRAWKKWGQGHGGEAGRCYNQKLCKHGRFKAIEMSRAHAENGKNWGGRQRQGHNAERRPGFVVDAWRDADRPYMFNKVARRWTYAEPRKDRKRQRHKVEGGAGRAASRLEEKAATSKVEKQRPEIVTMSMWSSLVTKSCGLTMFRERDWGCPVQSEECLPFHLIAGHIFRGLSVRQRCRLRCVCKAWNSWLTWDAQVATEKEEAEYWFMFLDFVMNEVTISSVKGRCYRLPLCKPPLALLRSLDMNVEFGPSYLLASAGGLMCAVGRRMVVFIFNCLTGAWVMLPKNVVMDGEPFVYLYLQVDGEDPFRYYVLISQLPLGMCACDLDMDFEVFDSKAGIWKVGRSPQLHSSTGSKLSWLDADFFNAGNSTGGTLNLQAYHASHNAWSTVQVVDSASLVCEHFDAFLKYKGRLFLCFMYCQSNSAALCGLAIGEVQCTGPNMGTYVEVAKTPEHYLQPLDNVWNVRAEGHLFYSIGYKTSILYDIAHDTWHVLPYLEKHLLVSAHRPMMSMCLA